MRDLFGLIPSWLEDPSAYVQPANLDLSTVALVAVFNFFAGLFCLGVFEVCRRRWPWMYSPKGKVMKGFGRPLGWIRPLMRLSDEELLENCGYDALTYLRFLKMATKIFAAFAPYAFIVLLPVNASVSFLSNETGDFISVQSVPEEFPEIIERKTKNTFNRLSMSSMPLKDPRMWAHSLGVYVLTGVALYFLSEECQWYARLRHRFLTGQSEARHRTVAVTQIPVELRDSAKLAKYFEKLYPGKVVGAVVARSVRRLDRLASERDAAKARLLRLRERKTREKLQRSKKLSGRFARLLENIYDPRWWLSYSEDDRVSFHAAAIERLEGLMATERNRHHNRGGPLVARPPCDDDQSRRQPQKAIPSYRALDVQEEDDDECFSEASDDNEPLFCRREADAEEASLLRGSSSSSREKKSWKRFGLRVVNFCEAHQKTTRDSEALDAGFVTMRSFAGVAVATQVFHAATPGGMVAKVAPEPKDVFWPNLGVFPSRSRRTTRRVLANAIVALLLIFYVVPVTLLSFVLSEQAVKAKWPSMAKLCDESLFVNVSVQMLQPAGLIGLMLLLPPFFLGLGFWEGHTSWSANTLSQLSRYYSFQITNVLLVTTVAGSLLKCLQRILEHPKDTFQLLGESLPQVCAFFSCYIFIKAFLGLPLELCRGVTFVQEFAKRLIYPSSTDRDRRVAVLGLRDFLNPGFFSYGKFAAQDLLVVVLVMTYAVMAPVILVPGLLFFLFAQIVYRHQLLYVYLPLFDSGGLLWPRIYRRTLFALFIFQSTMTGLFFLKQNYNQGYATILLSCFTYAYKTHMKAIYSTSSSVAHHLPMELATAVDDAMQAFTPTTNQKTKEAHDDDAKLWAGLNEYLQPNLRGEEEELPMMVE